MWSWASTLRWPGARILGSPAKAVARIATLPKPQVMEQAGRQDQNATTSGKPRVDEKGNWTPPSSGAGDATSGE